MCVVNSKDSKQYLQMEEFSKVQIKPCILNLFGCTQYVKIINFKCSMSMFCITFSEY